VNIDDLIRDTVRSQEELAVDPDRVRAGLPARAARRQRVRTRAMLATVAAGVAVAVAVPVVILGDSGTVVTATAPQATLALEYGPTWLPDGLVENFRGATYFIPGVTRMWRSTAPESADRPNPGLTMLVRPASPDDVDRAPNVDINGVPGYFGEGSVIWEVGDTKFVIAGRFPDADMLRIARSVKPDPTRMRLPVQFNWLPTGGAEWTRKVDDPSVKVTGFSATEYEATVLVYDSQHYVQASVGTNDFTVREIHGREVVVNGRTATLARDVQMDPTGQDMLTNWVLTMNLDDGRRLFVNSGAVKNSPPLSEADFLRVVEQVQLDPNPEVGWLEKR
jgi:hypothetical protein